MDRTYVRKIAENTRRQLLEEKLIQPIQKGFTNEELENIVQFFGGKLISDDETERAVLESVSTTEFIIHCNPWYGFIYVFQELGRRLLSIYGMIDNQTFTSITNEKEDIEFFARELLMPEDEFFKVVEKYTKDGKCSAYAIEREFGVNLDVIDERCHDLGIQDRWKIGFGRKEE